MASKREEVLQALLAQLKSVPLVKVERNRLRPERLPPEGLIILRDGDVGEPEILLSPLSYVWTHAARIEAFSGAGDPDGHLDDLLMAIATALTADPTLGAPVKWHAQSLVQLWCFVEMVAAKGKLEPERILRDAAKRGYGVQALVSSPRPRSSKGVTVKSPDALIDAYEAAQRLLEAEPEALGFFRAQVSAHHECPDGMEAYHHEIGRAHV